MSDSPSDSLSLILRTTQLNCQDSVCQRRLVARHFIAGMSLLTVALHFTVLEMAADWHELMILQHIVRPSVACANEQLVLQCRYRHTTTSISYSSLHPVACKLLLVSRPIEGRRQQQKELASCSMLPASKPSAPQTVASQF